LADDSVVRILLQPIEQVGPAAEPERSGKNVSVQAGSTKNWIPERQPQQQQQKEVPGRAKGRQEMEISAPFNFHHNVHVRVKTPNPFCSDFSRLSLWKCVSMQCSRFREREQKKEALSRVCSSFEIVLGKRRKATRDD
jgi:hypothetical protein